MDIVLVTPQIPQNTGSIARTCAATHTPLHLIEPLGFEISEKAVRRAGLDYWPYVELTCHASFESYLVNRKPGRCWYLSKYAKRAYFEAQFSENDALVFGDEVNGLGVSFLNQQPADQLLLIPMDEPNVRSLNLSNAVAVVLYEARRQFAITK